MPKRVPGSYFFGVFSKTAISSKSRSRLGNNRIFEGRTFQKSIRRATPNGDGKKKRQKSLPAPSPDALFRLRARFLSILGSRPGPENRQKPVPKPGDIGFFCGRKSFFCVFFARARSGRVPERFRRLRRPSRIRFFSRILRYFSAGFCDSFLRVACRFCQGLSGSAGMLPGSASRRSNPFAVFPRGTAIRAAI